MTKIQMEKKLAFLKAMHKVIVEMGDEEAYMEWIELVPDCATGEDLKEIVKDIELLVQTENLFWKIMKRYGEPKDYINLAKYI